MTLEQKLCGAIWEGRASEAKELFVAGANVNYIDEYGWSPLHLALRQSNVKLAEFLVRCGANTEIMSRNSEKLCPKDIITANKLQVSLNRENLFENDIKEYLASYITTKPAVEVTVIPGIKLNIQNFMLRESELDKVVDSIYAKDGYRIVNVYSNRNIKHAIKIYEEHVEQYINDPALADSITYKLLGMLGLSDNLSLSVPNGYVLSCAGIQDIVKIEADENYSEAQVFEARQAFESLKASGTLLTDLTFDTRTSGMVKAQLENLELHDLGDVVIGCSHADCNTSKDHKANDVFLTGWTSDPSQARVIRYFDCTKIENWRVLKEFLDSHEISPESRFTGVTEHTYEIFDVFRRKDHHRTVEEVAIMREWTEYVQANIIRPGGEIKYWDSEQHQDVVYSPDILLGEGVLELSV